MVSLFIGEPRIQWSTLLGDSMRRFGIKRTKAEKSCKKLKEHYNNFKSRSGSHSGLDASIQAKKQA
jgi:hypothetical protein